MPSGLQPLNADALRRLGGNPQVIADLAQYKVTFTRAPQEGSFPIAICHVPGDGECPPEVETTLRRHFPEVWDKERTDEGYVFKVRIR